VRSLGVDLGERRIGVSLSDASGVLASPLAVITHVSRDADIQAIVKLGQAHNVERVIVGYPRSLDGSVGPQARRVDRFLVALSQHLGMPVVPWDERYSTIEAERLVHDAGKRVRRTRIDALAAAVILQSYLDAQR
jgi:putative holliday junction resolvase